MPRYANRTDSVQAAIVAALEQFGVIVELMPKPGDILCYYRSRFLPMEIKTMLRTSDTFKDGRPKKTVKLTASQLRRQMPIPIVRSIQEALLKIQEL